MTKPDVVVSYGAAGAADGRLVAAGRGFTAAAHWITLAVVVLLPLSMGGNRPPFWSAAGVALAAAGLCFAVAVLAGAVRPERWIAAPAAVFLLVVGWMAVQATPGAPAALEHPAWGLAEAALGRDLAGSISAQPTGTVDAIIRWLSFGVVFLVMAHTCRDAALARRTLAVVAATGGGVGAAAVVRHLSGPELLGGVEKWAYFDLLTGPFVNPNTFATYLGLCAVVALAGLLTFRAEARMSMAAPRRGSALRSAVLPAILAVLLLALLMTGSRAGIAASLLGLLLVLAGHLWRAGEGSRSAGFGAFAIAAVALSGLAVVLADVLGGDGRGAGGDLEYRFALFRSTVDAIAARPLLGHGAGAFPDVFSAYLADDVNLNRYRQAHNSFLELAAELGLPVAAAWVAALLLLAGRLAGDLALRRRYGLPLAALAAMATAGGHALFDFSVQVPGVALTLALILGVGSARPFDSRARRTDRNNFNQTSISIE